MLIVHVQHFLTEEGKNYFPIFVKEMKQAMIRYNKGFINLRILKKEDFDTETHFLLEYDNFELLQEFSKTKAHEDLIKEIKKYQIQKQSVIKYSAILD